MIEVGLGEVLGERGDTLLSPKNLLSWPNIAALRVPNPPQADEVAAFPNITEEIMFFRVGWLDPSHTTTTNTLH